jgi:hypothetical protein
MRPSSRRAVVYFVAAGAATLLTTPSLIESLMQMVLGGHGPVTALRLGFEYESLDGFAFFAAFRIVPFFAFALFAIFIGKVQPRLDARIPFWVATGTTAGVMLFASWDVYRPLFTHEHMSSTSAIAFIFIPFFAAAIGAVLALIVSIVLLLLRPQRTA